MSQVKERRRFERRSLSTTILFRPVDGPAGPFWSGQMRDISDGGVSFDTDDAPEEGAVVDMFFKQLANTADQRVRGRVAWVRPGDISAYTIGVSFTS
ncbi:MAG: PilZ domain-containing protein [Planctomycetota bacterium]